MMVVTAPYSSSAPLWLGLATCAVLVYRALMASLLQAFHGLPSLHRRRLLEDGSLSNRTLESLLAEPLALGMGITLWNQMLLVVLLLLVWPLRSVLPGGIWTLVPATLLYLWALDLALPTLVTSGRPDVWIRRLFPFYAPFHTLLKPFTVPMVGIVLRRREALEKERAEEDEPPSEEAVTALLEEGEAEGILEEEDRELIRNVVGFRDTVVREVMTPRTRIQALPVTAGAEDAWAAFREHRISRLPLYEGGIDRIVGVLLLKDMLQHPGETALDLRALAKPPLFVPESKPTLDLLRELQRARTQLAVVVDEFGAVSGIVTIEDLLEEVFGEIREEHESVAEVQQIASGAFLAPGQVHVEDLEDRLDVHFERDGFDTLGGLIMSRLGTVPKPGATLEEAGLRIRVLRMEGARIQLVQIVRLPEASE